jgi:mRNA interferase RelE/StbE
MESILPIIILPAAERYFKKIVDKTLKSKFKDATTEIRKNPSIGEAKVGDLVGIYGYDIYYNRTNYEIAYRLSENENGEVVVVIMAGTRENFWREIKKYIK